jgi:hypothetical protein
MAATRVLVLIWEEQLDFIAATLAYTPSRQLKLLEGCLHTFFDKLWTEGMESPDNGGPIWSNFDFREQELFSSTELLEKVGTNTWRG